MWLLTARKVDHLKVRLLILGAGGGRVQQELRSLSCIRSNGKAVLTLVEDVSHSDVIDPQGD